MTGPLVFRAARAWSLLLLLPLIVPVRALAQDLLVQASVDATTIGAEETVEFTITIQGADISDVERPEPPATEGLALMNPTPTSQRSISIVNGRMNQSIGFAWRFRPLRQQGDARIAAASVRIGSRTYRTDPITLRVVPQSQRPSRPQRQSSPFSLTPTIPSAPDEPRGVDEQDLFIRVSTSAYEAYPNEQVTLEYRLYFRQHIRLGQSRLADSWDAEGFWREDLDVEPRPIPTVEVVNGLRYNTIMLKRVAVFPTRAGTLTIDPLKIETEVYASSRDPFSSFLSRGRPEQINLASSPIRIEVEPLPPGAPPDFHGAVGSFRMNTTMGPTQVEVGEPVTLEVRLAGQGNLKPMAAPEVHVPGVFEVYDPQVDVALERVGARIRGTKSFKYVLVPRSNGTFTLPPMSFSYFDPEAEEYRTLRSDGAMLTVTGTAAPAPLTAAGADGLPVDDIAGLMTGSATWHATARTPLHQRPGVYVALVLPLLVLGGLVVVRRHATRLATDAAFARGRMAHPAARKHLKQAQALLHAGEARAFYEELERAVLGFIGNRLNVSERGFTRERLAALLGAAGVSATTQDGVERLLTECDAVRFAPIVPDQAAMEAALDRAGHLIAVLDDAFTAQPIAA